MDQSSKSLPSTPIDIIKKGILKAYGRGVLHFRIIFIVLILTLIFYDSSGYEVYIVGSIIAIGFSFIIRDSESKIKRYISIVLFLLVTLLDTTASVTSIIYFEFNPFTVFLFILDIVALGILIIYKMQKKMDSSTE